MRDALWRRLAGVPVSGPLGAAGLAELSAAVPFGALGDDPAVAALLSHVAEHSPFLWQLVRADPARAIRLLEAEPWAALAAILADARASADVGSALRRARQEIALLVALADLGGAWSLDDVTAALSRAADTFVRAALRAALREAHEGRRLRLADPEEPEIGCGLVVLAMGKHGACELNYSSDVDLIVLYDPAAAAIAPNGAAAPVFVHVVQRFVRLLGDRTAEGYVARVDLRLRPDPGSTAVAIALPAAFAYYEAYGQNWERAALIKARPVAGDLPLGARALQELAPFVWRRYFDYAAIADIHAMKRQIHAVRGHGEVRVAGHDVKLGRGGIREIEFFVQTQQLIFGGKRPALRGPRTLDMLAELHRDGWITAAAARDLAQAYRFLRTLEHRLQMVADEQTHRIPSDAQALGDLARFCGFADAEAFAAALGAHQDRVVAHYALLFEHAPALDTALGSLVFTGAEDDPETLETLAREGFRHPAIAAETVRGWHFGRRAAIRSARAREKLTALVPALLHAFAQSGDPDAALAAFDGALGHMPAASELLSILHGNVRLRALFADVLGGAPRLARVVTLKPHLLDSALGPAVFEAALDRNAFVARCADVLAPARTMEEVLDAVRDFAAEEMFTVGLRLFSATLAPEQAGAGYSALAEAVVATLFARVRSAFAQRHGSVPDATCVVLALGRLGAGAMTAASDLDLMLIYDFDRARPLSDGPSPLHAVQYHIRLTQRLISALTVATRRGRLYEVDMRLRPSGRQGPLATQLRSFVDYQDRTAETWERMALTRARPIAGDPALAARVVTIVRSMLRRPPAPGLAADVAAMRRQVAAAKGESDAWDLKLAAGGIMDVDFVAQYLQLRYGADEPDLVAPATGATLAAVVQRAILPKAEGDVLVRAHAMYENLLQIMRLTIEAGASPPSAPAAVGRRLAAAVDLPDMARLARELRATQAAVRSVFDAVVG